MNVTPIAVTSVLNGLIETCKDGQDGYRAVRACVRNADFKALFHSLSTQRLQYTRELQRVVRGLHEKPERHGSMTGAAHRSWIHVKAAMTNGDEESMLSECERGEESAVEEYRQALAHEELPDDVRDMLRLQFMGVEGARRQIHEALEHFRRCGLTNSGGRAA